MVTAGYERGPAHPEALATLADIAAAGDPDLSALSPAQARASRRTRFATADPTPVIGIDEVDIAAVPTRIYRGRDRVAPALVWLHGGGWVMGGWDTHDEILRVLASRTGFHVVAPEYRLAPEHPFPARLDDSIAVIEAVAATPDRYGVEPGRLSIGGDSAGGNLAAVAALAITQATIDRLVLAYPVTDCRFGTASFREDSSQSYLRPEWLEWFRGHYLTPDQAVHDWRVSPLLAPRSGLAALGDVMVVVASHDPLRDEGLEFAERVGEAGGQVRTVIADGFPHGFLAFARRSPAASAYFDEMVDFIRQ